MVDRDVVEKY